MIQTTQEAIDWIGKWDTFSIKLGTERMEWILERLGHPERHLRVIHVAGTNGKGSTVSYISHILREAGYTVGTFTSPAMETFNDRITVNGQVISDEDLLTTANLIYENAEALERTDLGAPTEFEVITLLSMVYFAKVAYCDFTILEVGLGGRYDSTNVTHPLIGVITNIGMDHVQQLGPTLRDIAAEKAGIIKSGMPIVTGADGEALEVIIDHAQHKKAKLYTLDREFRIEDVCHLSSGEQFTMISPFKRYEALDLSMFGEHQVNNAALGLMVIDYLRTYLAVQVDEEHIRKGLKKAFWPGRFEKVSDKPLVILDGAHNIEGMSALVDTIRHHYPNHKIKVLFASLIDKDNSSILGKLVEIADHVTFTTFDHYRAIDPNVLAQMAPKELGSKIVSDWNAAFVEMRHTLDDHSVLLITGSLYFIADVRKSLV